MCVDVIDEFLPFITEVKAVKKIAMATYVLIREMTSWPKLLMADRISNKNNLIHAGSIKTRKSFSRSSTNPATHF